MTFHPEELWHLLLALNPKDVINHGSMLARIKTIQQDINYTTFREGETGKNACLTHLKLIC